MQIINLSFCICTQGYQEQIMVWLLCSFQENMIWSDSVFLLCPAKQPYGTVHGKNRHPQRAMFGFDQQLTSTLLFPGCSLPVPCLFPGCVLLFSTKDALLAPGKSTLLLSRWGLAGISFVHSRPSACGGWQGLFLFRQVISACAVTPSTELRNWYCW